MFESGKGTWCAPSRTIYRYVLEQATQETRALDRGLSGKTEPSRVPRVNESRIALPSFKTLAVAVRDFQGGLELLLGHAARARLTLPIFSEGTTRLFPA